MPHNIQGHDAVLERFQTAARKGRVGGTYLFVGPNGIGKRTMAIEIAKALLCLDPNASNAVQPCERCESCKMVDGNSHPDLEIVYKREDKQVFSIGILVGEKDEKKPAGLLHRMSLKPSLSSRKIAIINDADLFNIESSNKLLKTLEEPNPGAVFILLSSSLARILPTVRSRSQVVRFHPLPEATVAEILLSKEMVSDPARAREIAAASNGSLAAATELCEEETWGLRQTLLDALGAARFDSIQLSKAMQTFIDAAGKDTKAKRLRQRQVVEFAIDYFRAAIRTEAGVPTEADPLLKRAVQSALSRDGAILDNVHQLEMCLDALGYLGNNVNQATFIEWWVGELA